MLTVNLQKLVCIIGYFTTQLNSLLKHVPADGTTVPLYYKFAVNNNNRKEV